MSEQVKYTEKFEELPLIVKILLLFFLNALIRVSYFMRVPFDSSYTVIPQFLISWASDSSL